MAEKTKAQLIVEVRELKKQREELRSQLEQHISESTEKDGEIAELTENLRTANQKAGNLESENAELEAFKKDALQAMDNQSKEIELMKENRKLADAIIEKQKNRIITLEGKTIDLATDIGAAYKSKHDLLTGSLVNLIREWMYQKYGIGKGGRA